MNARHPCKGPVARTGLFALAPCRFICGTIPCTRPRNDIRQHEPRPTIPHTQLFCKTTPTATAQQSTAASQLLWVRTSPPRAVSFTPKFDTGRRPHAMQQHSVGCVQQHCNRTAAQLPQRLSVMQERPLPTSAHAVGTTLVEWAGRPAGCMHVCMYAHHLYTTSVCRWHVERLAIARCTFMWISTVQLSKVPLATQTGLNTLCSAACKPPPYPLITSSVSASKTLLLQLA